MVRDSCVRARSRSGHLLLLSVELPRPSVMLSPMIMRAFDDLGTEISTEVRKYLALMSELKYQDNKPL